ncbi:adenosine receptor A2b isoform X1 [Hydra vulgaris]|uniref:adenosine receptor A2b isoform X1 n=1 Tax=Hydra vulgaris TaxID=6087 RepID=UPI0006410B83|nr:adenosine receptor A2b [Hydra vulgaris]
MSNRYFVQEKFYNFTNSTNFFIETSMISSNTENCKMVISLKTIFYSLLMILILLASVMGNIVVVTAILISKGLRRKTTMNFVISLAFSDLLLSCFKIPIIILTILKNMDFCQSLAACYLFIITDVVGNVASILNLLLIAIDRFIAVSFPFRYSDWITLKRTKILSTGIWLFAFFWSAAGLFKWDNVKKQATTIDRGVCKNTNLVYYAVSFYGIYITALIIMTCIYLKILHVAKGHIDAIDAVTPAQHNPHSASIKEQLLKDKRKKRLSRELKLTKSFGIAYLAFLACWLPSCIINIIIKIDQDYFQNLKRSHPTLFDFLYYFSIIILPSMNTMLNPIIYSFYNQHFLRAFKDVVNKFIMKRNTFAERKSTKVTSVNVYNFNHIHQKKTF